MKTISVIVLVGMILVGFVGQALAGAKTGLTGKEAFEVMKGLAGEWHGTIHEQGRGPEVTVVYRVTSAGTAVMETLFPGTDHEMVTMYTVDGDKLLLTHYCAMGNQPRMLLSKKSTQSDLVFDFAGGSNLNPKKDAHMHSARIVVEGPDSIRGEWSGFKTGKQKEVTKFFLARKKQTT
jgi:hypothetical protein